MANETFYFAVGMSQTDKINDEPGGNRSVAVGPSPNDPPTYTGNDCDNCGRNRVEHSRWDEQGREICEKCHKVQGSDERVDPNPLGA